MKIVYLPGFSLKNKEEGDHITSLLMEKGFDVYYQQWRHWDETIAKDWSIELRILKTAVEDDQELIVTGKSIGTYIALDLIRTSLEKIKQVILMGIPANDFDNQAELQEYPGTLKALNVPIYVIQNSQDDHGTAEQVKELLQGVNYKLIEKVSDNHRYDYPEDVLQLISPAGGIIAA